MNWIKTQSELFFLALSFFSRLPIPASTPYSEERMNRAGRYFALVGALLGFLCALSYLLLTTLFPADIAIFLTMALSLMLTGAFHEDGLTDMADGVGGGMTTERRLAIMKDSRIGTYGASALIMALLGKYLLLSELAVRTELFWIWIAAYTLSRTVAASLIFNTPYVSDSDQSKSKPLAQKQSPNELLFLICCGLLSIWWLTPLAAAIVVSVALAFRFTFKRWLVSRLGGFTGDCLGAGQQIMELLFYCVILALLNTGNF